MRRLTSIREDYLALLTGSVFFSVALQYFLSPGDVLVGGISGLATLLHEHIGLPLGIGIFAMNLPLLLFNLHFYGWRFLKRSVIGVVSTTIMTELLGRLPIRFDSNRFLCAVIGGVLMGFGCGILLRHSYTTGGTDLIAYLVLIPFPHVPLGTIIFGVDAVILMIGASVNHDVVLLPYSVLCAFLYTESVNYFVQGKTALGRIFRKYIKKV